jgi:hypothetical protein
MRRRFVALSHLVKKQHQQGENWTKTGCLTFILRAGLSDKHLVDVYKSKNKTLFKQWP